MRADLHNHTRSSDGELSPEELVALAAQAKLTHLGVTDHDTVAGLEAAGRAALDAGLELVPGIEITTELHGRELHMLGLFMVPSAQVLQDFSHSMKNERFDRLKAMTTQLQEHGLSVEWDDVLAQAAGATSMGRPHLAKALVARGQVSGIQEAFDRYLSPKTPGWVERYRPTHSEAIALIHQAGGVASVAHPGVNQVSKNELKLLSDAGLDAVEAHHPGHPPSQAEAYERWGKEMGLLSTGGSDFHSERFGHQLGSFVTPASAFPLLFERATTRTQEAGLSDALSAWWKALRREEEEESD